MAFAAFSGRFGSGRSWQFLRYARAIGGVTFGAALLERISHFNNIWQFTENVSKLSLWWPQQVIAKDASANASFDESRRRRLDVVVDAFVPDVPDDQELPLPLILDGSFYGWKERKQAGSVCPRCVIYVVKFQELYRAALNPFTSYEDAVTKDDVELRDVVRLSLSEVDPLDAHPIRCCMPQRMGRTSRCWNGCLSMWPAMPNSTRSSGGWGSTRGYRSFMWALNPVAWRSWSCCGGT